MASADAKFVPQLAQVVFDNPALVAATTLRNQFVEGVAVLGENLSLWVAPVGGVVVGYWQKDVGLERGFLTLGRVNTSWLGLENVAVAGLKRVALNEKVLVLDRLVLLDVVASEGIALLVIRLGLRQGGAATEE